MPSASSESTQSLGPSIADGEEIVVKDKNGDYKLDIPVLPPAVGEDGDEMEGMEGGATRGSGPTGAESTAQTEISGHEKESKLTSTIRPLLADNILIAIDLEIEASLVEMMYRSRNRQMSTEPAEILNLIHQSLRNKVASLDEDNWIYEPEPDSLF
ncbi:hypothetical protein APSETT444_006615 [Aspergillus pseudonomiae]